MVDRDDTPERQPSPERGEDIQKRFKTFVDNLAVVTGQDPSDMDPVRYGTYYLPGEGPVPHDRVVIEIYQFRDEDHIDKETGDSYYLEYHKVIIKDGDIVLLEVTLENDKFFFSAHNGTDLHYPTKEIEYQKIAQILDSLQMSEMTPDSETEGALESLAHPIELAADIALDRLRDYKTDKLLVAVHHKTFRRLLIEREGEDTVHFTLFDSWVPVRDSPDDPITWLRRCDSMTRTAGLAYVEIDHSVQLARQEGGRWMGSQQPFYEDNELSDEEEVAVDTDMILLLCYMLRSRSMYDNHVEESGDKAAAIATPYPLEEDAG